MVRKLKITENEKYTLGHFPAGGRRLRYLD